MIIQLNKENLKNYWVLARLNKPIVADVLGALDRQ